MLSEFIYGGMDGIITTVAIISGSFGAQLPNKYTFALGAANVIADGFSMGVSRFNSLIDVEEMPNSDLGRKSPLLSAFATFIFFVLMGSIPLSPFLLYEYHNQEQLQYTLFVFSIIAFIIIGTIKGIQNNKLSKSVIQTVLIGSLGASISYFVAKYVKSI